jgi:hypothetical protein
MPAPNSILQYPSQWLDLIRVVSNGRCITVTQMGGQPLTKARAAQLRFRFYHLRGILRKDPLQHETYAMSEGVEVTIAESPDGWSTRFAPRDQNAVGLALQDALKEVLNG